uniref:Uncharacterized protein n=1 Tax=Romanomermis culicivorax TaxID=13658 RepID=A0A915J1Y8_ROMCU
MSGVPKDGNHPIKGVAPPPMFIYTRTLRNQPPKVRIVEPATAGQIRIRPFGNVNLTCAASGVPEPSVSWKQDGEILRSFGRQGPAANETSKSVFIQRLVENTAFVCEAINQIGSDTAKVDVVIMGRVSCFERGPGSPPENLDVNVHQNNVNMQWKQPIITNGIVTGYNIYYTTNQSLPIKKWNMIPVHSTARQTTFKLENLEEEALYYIRVAGTTILGEGVHTQTHQASTQRRTYAPEATLTPPDSKSVYMFRNNTAQKRPYSVAKYSLYAEDNALYSEYAVTCTADGYPQPKLVWYRDGQPVGFRAITDDVKSISAVLTVQNLLTSSLFQCKADNDLGSSLKEVFIEILGPGSPPNNVKYMPYSTNIALVWDKPEIPNGEITGYEIVYTLNPEDHFNNWSRVTLDNGQKEHKLTGLEPLRPYIIQIRAFNDKGHGPWTPPFVVTTGRAETPPVITLTPKQSLVAVEPGSSINLTCSADGFPQPTVLWFEGKNPVSYDSGSEITILKENILEPTVFECKATNLFGVQQKSITVDVTGPGEPPLRFTAEVKGRNVLLSWLPPRIKNGILQSFVIYYATEPNRDLSKWEVLHVPAKGADQKTPFYDAKITNMPPSKTFYFRSRAISDKGLGVVSEPLAVTTEERDYFINSEVQPGATVEVPLNGGLEAKCTATGYPPPTVTFRQNDKPMVAPRPYSNGIFLDNISGPVSLECYATSAAGTAIKTIHIFPSGTYT